MLQNGTTGLGGKFDITLKKVAESSFIIESISPTCEKTKLIRVQVNDPLLPSPMSSSYGVGNSVETIYLKPQKMTADSECGIEKGVTEPVDWSEEITPGQIPTTIEAEGKVKQPVVTPSQTPEH
jgi:hypothetical protein